jgi:2-oxoglutarate dehydrogenase E2 component (dihydrolipoamide succinyltransferase)
MSNIIQVIIPQLGESVTEATIASITKQVGEFIEVDELFMELETDKVTLEVNAPSSGKITKITVEEGDTVRVAQIVADIDVSEVAEKGSSQSTQEERQKKTEVTQNIQQSNSDKILSPAANKIAEEKGIDKNNIQGTGKDGRVTKSDVLDYKATNISSAEITPRGEEVVKMSKLRQTIAKRLKDSQNTAAILTTFNEIDMKPVIDLRNKYKDIFMKKHGIKLGFMSFFIKACTTALQEIPSVNAEIKDNTIVYKNYCDIGVAVGSPTGLVVPVIRNAEGMSCAELEAQIVDFGKRARDGKLTMEDMAGGTFTVSNGGVYGSLLSTPIINPPQSGILGMHKTQERPVVVDGKIEIRPMMYIALSYDHRIIDGKEAVTFLVRVKELLEDPARLILDV